MLFGLLGWEGGASGIWWTHREAMGMSKGGGKGSVGVGWPVRVLAWCAFLVLAGSFWMLYFYEISHGTDEGEEEIWSGFKEDLTWRLRTLADFITITNAFTINLFFWW